MQKQNIEARYRVKALFNSVWAPVRYWPRVTQREALKTLYTIEKNKQFVSGVVERKTPSGWVEVEKWPVS